MPTLAVLNFVDTWNSFLWPLVTARDMDIQVILAVLFLLATVTNEGINFGAGERFYAGYVLASIPLVILFFALGKFYVEGLVESGIKA